MFLLEAGMWLSSSASSLTEYEPARNVWKALGECVLVFVLGGAETRLREGSSGEIPTHTE